MIYLYYLTVIGAIALGVIVVWVVVRTILNRITEWVAIHKFKKEAEPLVPMIEEATAELESMSSFDKRFSAEDEKSFLVKHSDLIKCTREPTPLC